MIQNFFVENYFPDKYVDFYLEKKATYDFFNKYVENDKMPKPFNISLFQEELNLNLVKINQLKSINITHEIIDKLFNSTSIEKELKTGMKNYLKETNKKNNYLWIITNCNLIHKLFSLLLNAKINLFKQAVLWLVECWVHLLPNT